MFFRCRSISEEELPTGSPVMVLYAYWLAHRNCSAIPGRSDIDAAELPPRSIPWLFILDVVRAGEALDFRYRLAGHGVGRLIGSNPSGRLASELFAGNEAALILTLLGDTVGMAAPTLWRALASAEPRGSIGVDGGLFPLSGEGDDVDKIIGIVIPTRLPQAGLSHRGLIEPAADLLPR